MVKLKDVDIFSNDMLKKYNLSDWSIFYTKRKDIFGLCDYKNKKLILSIYYFPYMNFENIKNVVIHEIAHILTKGHKHDKYWKKMCIDMGGDGKIIGDLKSYINDIEMFIKIEKLNLKYKYGRTII